MTTEDVQTQSMRPTDLQRERVSSLIDGELETGAVLTSLDAIKHDPALRQTLRDFILISDVVRGIEPTALSPDFSHRVAQAIQREPVYLLSGAARQEALSGSEGPIPAILRDARRRRRLLAGMAASLAAVGLVSGALVMTLQEAPDGGQFAAVQSEQAVVTNANWEDARIRALLDAHGTMAVKLRLSEEQ